MSRSMIQAAVTMNQLQQKLDLIGNNLANSETNGYKAQDANFSSLLFQQMDNVGAPESERDRRTPSGVRVGSGAALGHTNRNTDPGSLKETERELDTALSNENQFFQVQVTENGTPETRYTRDGAFYLSPTADGQEVMLTTEDGSPVMGGNGPIQFADGFDAIDIQEDGQVTIKRGDQSEDAGTLSIVETVRPQLLEATGDNRYKLSDLEEWNAGDVMQAVEPDEKSVKSGILEQSNVDMPEQMTDMMEAQQAYQLNGQTITMDDQMKDLVNQLR